MSTVNSCPPVGNLSWKYTFMDSSWGSVSVSLVMFGCEIVGAFLLAPLVDGSLERLLKVLWDIMYVDRHVFVVSVWVVVSLLHLVAVLAGIGIVEISRLVMPCVGAFES